MFDLSPDESQPAEPDILRAFLEDLRVCGEIAPAPEFYERVCSRIQEIEGQSIWVPLIYTRFRWRFATAWLALALATLCYVLAEGGSANNAIFSSANPQQRRDAVLDEIVSYRKPN